MKPFGEGLAVEVLAGPMWWKGNKPWGRTTNVDPKVLGIVGSTQPEVFQGTVAAMVQLLQKDAARFWQESQLRDGPIDIWIINGERFLYNGNHRFHAAVQAGVMIPSSNVRMIDKTGTQIATYLLKDLVWLTGMK